MKTSTTKLRSAFPLFVVFNKAVSKNLLPQDRVLESEDTALDGKLVGPTPPGSNRAAMITAATQQTRAPMIHHL